MTIEYLKISPEAQKKELERQEKYGNIRQLMVSLVSELNQKYKESKQSPERVLDVFLTQRFRH